MGIYIHIPFCSSKCHYCNFFSQATKNNQIIDDYTNAICREIVLQKNYLKTKKINTIYIGGGTPTLLNINQLHKIFKTIFEHFDLQTENEITIEANPENLTKNFLKDLKNHTPVNRLSVGLQSFLPAELSLMNRKHSVETSIEAIKNIQNAGFENITGDLIFGLPNQTLEQWDYNLDQFFALNIPHLSAYSLTIEENTVFDYWKNKNKITETSDILFKKMYEKLIKKAKKANFLHYEISNFAKKGFIAKHNFSYWTGQKYLGVGSSAHSFDQKSRQWNVANVKKYIKSIQDGTIPAEIEKLTDNERFNEALLTGLRTYRGVDSALLESNFTDFYKQILPILNNFRQNGLIKFVENHWILSSKGKFISDSIISELMIPECP